MLNDKDVKDDDLDDWGFDEPDVAMDEAMLVHVEKAQKRISIMQKCLSFLNENVDMEKGANALSEFIGMSYGTDFSVKTMDVFVFGHEAHIFDTFLSKKACIPSFLNAYEINFVFGPREQGWHLPMMFLSELCMWPFDPGGWKPLAMYCC